ncbi:phosphatidylserine/phosphatidylglycerophosphate/cardiolipin synthase-like enzyme [Tahibacter aquaticus]|uniref:Phosphatidylserine/phosphatidylglycerophosphate/ cardiolipin synthase-like enzyme n=1 Tax=Tahibacter aquaticus TaxID=520092 RepID=A0A4R6Z6S0_9GAMM|nr:phospholipase D family protein [Tahibacter aquaticus]TDR47432.1 phosphatidylserine/phosphatidylglycerophosphate/cardiolipin synthase-like enzyme [Tahibacter aquaticus]
MRKGFLPLLLALLGASLLLGGCTLSRERVRKADAVIEQLRDHEISCARADHCATYSPYHELYRESAASATPLHFVTLLDHGADSLALRLHLVRSARKSIEVQTFIFAADDSGYLFLDELIKAARRGVKVRVIADQMFSLGDYSLLARLARAHANFELRLYNPTFDDGTTQPLEFAASIVCCFFKFNQRMHNKLLLIDGETGVAGGRNYEDRYFDWDPEFDYRDRDVLVTGVRAGAQMQASFEQFWKHQRTRGMTQLKDVNRRLLQTERDPPPPWDMPPWVRPLRVEAISRQADDWNWVASTFVAPSFRVADVDYFSDSPNKPLEPENKADKALTRRIITLLEGAEHEIVLQTPYLVISRPARRVFRELRERKPELRVIVSTNSLAATDAFYVYALSHKYKKRYIKHLGFEIHEFKPFPADAALLIPGYAELTALKQQGEQTVDTGAEQLDMPAPVEQTTGPRLGMHAKSIVIDERISLIGSHNFDPRSDNYNTESGFIIHDVPFAAALRKSILRDTEPQNAWVIARRPRPLLLERLNNAMNDFSAALPLFDFWPFRYATSFELKPGCAPLRPSDPGFYDCYEPVGDFPGVDLPLKSIYTRIVTAFGAGLVGIL